MKKYIFCISVLSFLFCCWGCKKDEIITSKPGTPLSPVTDLKSSISGNQVNLTWKLPSSIPDDIIQPVSVAVTVSVVGGTTSTIILADAPESYTYTSYDPSKNYRFTVKVMGNVDTTDPHVSNLRYSLGETVAL